MKPLMIGLCLGLFCLSLSAQQNDYYQKGESLISIRNPKFGIQGSRNEWVSIAGTQLDYGHFIKDRWLIGGGLQGFYNFIDEPNKDYYNLGIQLFGRYYFKPFGKKDQFILFAESRLGATRNYSQSGNSGGDFLPLSTNYFAATGFHCAWRPFNRISFDLGVQAQLALGRSIAAGLGEFGSPLFSLPGILSANIHL